MEVHPPEHGIHSWRDFFVHMGTITLGLLIALGLEQGVELLHHREQLHRLREDLHVECELNVKRTEGALVTVQQLQLLNSMRLDGLRKALKTNGPAPPEFDPIPQPTWDDPGDPVWLAAKQGNVVALMPRAETQIYSELDASIQQFHTSFEATDSLRFGAFLFRNGSFAEIRQGSRQVQEEYLSLLSEGQAALYMALENITFLVAEEKAVADGATTLEQVTAAGHKQNPAALVPPDNTAPLRPQTVSAAAPASASVPRMNLSGTYKLRDTARPTSIMQLNIMQHARDIQIEQIGGGVTSTLRAKLNGTPAGYTLQGPGAEGLPHDVFEEAGTVRAWFEGETLVLEREFPHYSIWGPYRVDATQRYTLSQDGKELTVQTSFLYPKMPDDMHVDQAKSKEKTYLRTGQ